MFEKENDLDGDERVVVCPNNSNHKVCVSQMARHLGECRKNACVSETAICSFNKNHEINVPELNYHKQTCPDKLEDFEAGDDDCQGKTERGDCGENNKPKEKENDSDFDSNFASDIESTGCFNRKPEGGGIHNHISVKKQNGERNCETPTHTEEELANEQVYVPCEVVVHNCETAVSEEPPNRSAAIERRFSQSESDTASSESELSSTTEAGNSSENFEQTPEVLHFDYKKFAPSPEIKEEFLKVISQEKESQWYGQEKYQVGMNTGYCTLAWHQGCHGAYVPPQYPLPNSGYCMPHAYITFSNGYPMMAPIPANPLYAHGPYIFPQSAQGNGCFIPNTNHGLGYEYGGNYRHRPHYNRSYKRRGYPNYSHPRNNNYHTYNSYNGHNSTDTDSNSTTSSSPSDNGSVEENGYPHKNENHEQAYDEPPVNGINSKKNLAKQHLKQRLPGLSSKSSLKVEKAKVNFEQFVKIEKVEAGKQTNGKIERVKVIPITQETNHNTVTNNGTKSEKEKQIRKLRKKLSEVLSLEEKKRGGIKLDCDQLKKLTRKRELEDQLAVLQIN